MRRYLEFEEDSRDLVLGKSYNNLLTQVCPQCLGDYHNLVGHDQEPSGKSRRSLCVPLVVLVYQCF